LLVWEKRSYPTYYVPQADVAMQLLAASDTIDDSSDLGEARFWTVKTARAQAEDAARQYPESPTDEIREAIRFDWNAMDSWFEEDEEVFVHPRDPHKRIDALHSSRRVVVEIDGVTVADCARPVVLFETGLPARYYLPKTDVRMELLLPSDNLTRCPYKGVAEWYSVSVDGKTYEDFVWWYRNPAHESAAIAALVAFYNEKVDLIIDGVRQDRPVTQFS
jgi:uncharacterized protein (DUF427 family)